MILIELIRRGWFDFGVYGELALPSGARIFTVERPWLENWLNVSCIPTGGYDVEPSVFQRGDGGRGYPAAEVLEVPGRSAIKFHGANWPWQVQGCIGPNLSLAPGDDGCPLRGRNSRVALARLLEETDGGRFRLEVR